MILELPKGIFSAPASQRAEMKIPKSKYKYGNILCLFVEYVLLNK